MKKYLLIVSISILFLSGCGQKNPAKILQDVKDNKENIMEKVEEVRKERAVEAQKTGYPKIWLEADLPEYPNGKLTKVRATMGQVNLETSDDPAIIKSFFDKEMKSRGFIIEQTAASPMVATSFYKKEQAVLHMQAIKNEKQKTTKIILSYTKN